MEVGWLVILFYGVSTIFGSFNAKSSHFDKKFGLVWFNGKSTIVG